MEVVLLNAPRKENGVLTFLSVFVSLRVPSYGESDELVCLGLCWS